MELDITGEQFVNLLRFIAIFGYGEQIIQHSPDYILEKFVRFIGLPQEINTWCNPGGLHPVLEKAVVEKYMKTWRPVFKDDDIED